MGYVVYNDLLEVLLLYRALRRHIVCVSKNKQTRARGEETSSSPQHVCKCCTRERRVFPETLHRLHIWTTRQDISKTTLGKALASAQSQPFKYVPNEYGHLLSPQNTCINMHCRSGKAHDRKGKTLQDLHHPRLRA